MSEFGLRLDRFGLGAPAIKPKDDMGGAAGFPKNIETSPGQKSFVEFLQESLNSVNEVQLDADKAAQSFAKGENIQLHEVLVAMEKADVALRTVTAFRNKLVEAYQEIMRMPV